jgi:hypothetical protein
MPPSTRPKPNQPCSCGSGKKYRDCHALKDERRRRFVRKSRKLLTWVGGIAAVALVIYGLSQFSGVAYDDTRIGAVNFSGLNATQKRKALVAANAGHCTCGCGMTLAECVATDSTCPIRTDNIARIKAMVAEAME